MIVRFVNAAVDTFLVVFVGVFALSLFAITGGAPTAQETSLFRKEVSAVYVKTLLTIENAAREAREAQTGIG